MAKEESRARPVNMKGVLSLLILAIAIFAVIMYFQQPSQVFEYRVQLEEGIYHVRGIVRHGKDFTAYQSVEGKEAIQVCTDLNVELMKDRGGVLRSGKVSWRE